MKIIPVDGFKKPISKLTAIEKSKILLDAHLRRTVNDIIYGFSGKRPILPKNKIEEYGDSLLRMHNVLASIKNKRK